MCFSHYSFILYLLISRHECDSSKLSSWGRVGGGALTAGGRGGVKSDVAQPGKLSEACLSLIRSILSFRLKFPSVELFLHIGVILPGSSI